MGYSFFCAMILQQQLNLREPTEKARLSAAVVVSRLFSLLLALPVQTVLKRPTRLPRGTSSSLNNTVPDYIATLKQKPRQPWPPLPPPLNHPPYRPQTQQRLDSSTVAFYASSGCSQLQVGQGPKCLYILHRTRRGLVSLCCSSPPKGWTSVMNGNLVRHRRYFLGGRPSDRALNDAGGTFRLSEGGYL